MPVIVGNSTINTAITSASVTENTPQGFAVYNATRNTIMPTLRLNFVNSNVLDPRITFARSSFATYFNSAGVLTTATNNVPRFDYNPATGVCNGLLIEPFSVNLLLQSTFQSNWGPGAGTLTANQLLSPDGTVNAAKFVENTAVSAFHYINQSVSKAASALVYTFSVFLKASGNRQVTLRMDSGGSNGAVVNCDPVAGTIGTASVYGTFTSASATMQTIGNGWYRFSLTATSSTATTMVSQLETLNAGNNLYTGDGASGFYCFGAQLEQLAYSSSYITTTSSTTVRATDTTSLTGANFSSWYNSTNWSAIFTAVPSNIPNTSASSQSLFEFRIDGGNRILARINTSTSVLTAYWINTLSLPLNGGGYNTSALTANTAFKYGITASNGSWNLAFNGGVFISNVGGYLITPTELWIGGSPSDFTGFNGWIQSIAYYPTIVSNNELKTLTS
jgi:hypothetical protein